MAWQSSGSSNEALINNMYSHGLIKSDRVRQAMLGVDRAHYAPSMPYEDSPQSIGHAATISAPHMHASACESLLPYLNPGSKVLDIGSGSGYLTHVLAELVKPGGTVVGVEHIQPLVDLGSRNTAKSKEGRELLGGGGIVFVKGDGRKGWTGEGGEDGFDAIHVGAAAAGMQQDLIDQLKAPGRGHVAESLDQGCSFPVESTLMRWLSRLFIPVEENLMQNIWVVDKKKDGSVEKKKEYGVRYVPLTDRPKEYD